MDAKFFVDKIKSEKRYPDLQEDIAAELRIEGILQSMAIFNSSSVIWSFTCT